jgi:hypothetical protein
MALTLERYIYIKQKTLTDPNFVDKRKIKFTLSYLLLLWVGAGSFAMTKTFWIDLIFHEEVQTYACADSLTKTSNIIHIAFKWALAFVIPYIIIIIFSVLLLLFLKQWSKRTQKMLSNKTQIEMFNINAVVGKVVFRAMMMLAQHSV